MQDAPSGLAEEEDNVDQSVLTRMKATIGGIATLGAYITHP